MAGHLSRRSLIMRFGALVAHLLNSSQKITELDDAGLYITLLDLLGGAGGLQSKAYSQWLAGHALVEHRLSPEEAAQIYFERVIGRNLFLARGNHYHKGHELLHALCLRGAGRGWDKASLARSLDESAAIPLILPAGFDAVAARLASFSREISQSNPAVSTRAKHGPLFIEVSSARVELPEELSLWGAIRGAPRQLVSLSEDEWLAFRNLVIRAFEAANAPYAAFISIGLWPPDWGDVLSTHQVKQLSIFLTAAKMESRDHTISAWRQAWEGGKKVPLFKNADELWESSLGFALRESWWQPITHIDSIEIPSEEDAEDRSLEALDFEKTLQMCRAAGAIDDIEVWLYLEIREGRNAVELAQEPQMRTRLREKRLTMPQYLEALQLRIHDYVRGILEIHPDREGNG